jgi:hypothetical protein
MLKNFDFPVANKQEILDTSVMNTLESLHPPVMNTPGSQLLGVFGTIIRTGLQKKPFW